MNIKNGIKKFNAGVRRFGLLRATVGIATMLKFKVLNRKAGIVSTITDGLNIHFKFPDQFMPSLVVFRELVEPEFEFLRYILKRDSIFFDVGGGIGVYSMFAAKFVNGPIQIFEPVQENIQTIEQNLKANLIESKVRLNALALSSKDGFGRIKKNAKLFLSRLNNISMDYHIGAVKVNALDSFCFQKNINHIDILKIDVEGHECEVLEGAQKLLKKGKINIIILEINPQSYKLYNSLEQVGFDFFYYEYGNNSLKRIHPVHEENIRDLKPSPFHSNIILIRHEAVEGIKKILNEVNAEKKNCSV